MFWTLNKYIWIVKMYRSCCGLYVEISIKNYKIKRYPMYAQWWIYLFMRYNKVSTDIRCITLLWHVFNGDISENICVWTIWPVLETLFLKKNNVAKRSFKWYGELWELFMLTFNTSFLNYIRLRITFSI